jgi:hypothetical protein
MICFVLYICIIRYIAFQATIDTIHTTEEVREVHSVWTFDYSWIRLGIYVAFTLIRV